MPFNWQSPVDLHFADHQPLDHLSKKEKPRLAQMNKKELSERDICTKFITPALQKAYFQGRIFLILYYFLILYFQFHIN